MSHHGFLVLFEGRQVACGVQGGAAGSGAPHMARTRRVRVPKGTSGHPSSATKGGGPTDRDGDRSRVRVKVRRGSTVDPSADGGEEARERRTRATTQPAPAAAPTLPSPPMARTDPPPDRKKTVSMKAQRRLPRANVDEVVADPRKDPRREQD